MTRSVLFSTGYQVVAKQNERMAWARSPRCVECRPTNRFISFDSSTQDPEAPSVNRGPSVGKDANNTTTTIVDMKGACCFQLQADEVERPTEEVTAEVTQFIGTTIGEEDKEPAGDPASVTEVYTPQWELATFLNRPVRLATFDLALGEASTLYRTLDPWALFLGNTAIKKKLDNYAYLRGNLHVEVVVNATPFIYGMYMLSYRPMKQFTAFQDYTTGVFATQQNGRIPHSQRQNIRIVPHRNAGGTMVLPFLWHENMLRITSAADVSNMGQLVLQSVAPLRAANATATGPISLQIYGWMETVSLAGQTAKLALQSGEFATGPVSRPASQVAAAASMLSSLPVIGKFASVVAGGASAVSAVASIFGYTNVPVIDSSAPVKNTPFHGMASAQIAAPIEKLCLDPKACLTTDPSFLGLPAEDDLAISSFSQRESLLNVSTWSTADLTDTPIFTFNVCPSLCRADNVGTRSTVLDTPMGSMSRLFTNWRGDIKFTFRIYASQYHQGRLRVSFDPAGGNASADTSTVIQTAIIDIQDDDEFVITIPYMAPTTFLLTRTSTTSDYSTHGVVSGYSSDFHNGRLYLEVLNPLTAPSSTADVSVAAYVQAGSSFELANPSEVFFPASVLAPQSGEFELQTREIVMGTLNAPPPNRYLQNFGEAIGSARVLMRRTTFLQRLTLSTMNVDALDGVMTNADYFGIYPPEPGYLDTGGTGEFAYLGGRNTSKALAPLTTTHPCSLVATTPHSWLATCFVGQRGSFMYKANWLGPELQSFKALRWNYPQGNLRVTTNQSIEGTTAQSQAATWIAYSQPNGLTGQSLVNTKTQTGLEFSVPYMNKFNFSSTDPKYRVVGIDYDDSSSNQFILEQTLKVAASTKTTGALDLYGCVGNDYTLIKFLSVPWRYTYTIPKPS